jgi:predicted ATP-grasp superfamily ATP-dependent carboligase
VSRPPHVLVCGLSTRAAAASAAKAAFQVTTIDGYADLDQHPAVRALSMPRDFGGRPTALELARASRTIAADAVAYLSPFENHPRAVARLAAGRVLWGNPPEVLRAVRDPRRVADVLRRYGLPGPAGPSEGGAHARYLVKPLRSGGGQRIHIWDGGRIPRGSYLQQHVDGESGSVVFLAANGRAAPLAVTRQLIGDAVFGASGYRYCGSIVSSRAEELFERGDAVVVAAFRLTRAMAAEFNLRGLTGIDFVASGGVPYPVEVNPRWSSSMELVERLTGASLFAAHVAACTSGELPSSAGTVLNGATVVGKAIVFARREVVAGDTRAWLADPTVRDVPQPGERMQAGQPMCTVLASADDVPGCYAALEERARRVYRELEG